SSLLLPPCFCLFPYTTLFRSAYLDHAAIAPLATPVRSTIEVFLGRLTEEPFDLAHWERFRSQVRGRIAELLAVGPESIAFTKNRSEERRVGKECRERRGTGRR